MANVVFTEAKRLLANAQLDLDSHVFFCSFHGLSSSIPGQSSFTVNSSFTTSDEISGNNYVSGGFQLGLLPLQVDTGLGEVYMVANNLTVANLGPTASMKGILVYYKPSGAGQAWSTSTPIMWFDLAASPNGNDFTINWANNVSTSGKVCKVITA